MGSGQKAVGKEFMAVTPHHFGLSGELRVESGLSTALPSTSWVECRVGSSVAKLLAGLSLWSELLSKGHLFQRSVAVKGFYAIKALSLTLPTDR